MVFVSFFRPHFIFNVFHPKGRTRAGRALTKTRENEKFWGISRLKALEQKAEGTAQTFADFMDGLKGGVDLSAFDKADLPKVQAAFFPQFFLGQAQFEAGVADISPEGS